MARIGEPVSLLRDRKDREHGRVTFVELFFDLVFVFAVTQISHTLLERFTPLGVLQYGLVLLTVWWIWAYTTWVTNWFDPAQLLVRLLLFAMMLAGLLLSSSIPHAFDAHGLVFGLAVVAMQVGRTALILWWLRNEREGLRRTF